MSEKDKKRATKNSQKVAAFEENQRVLEAILSASREEADDKEEKSEVNCPKTKSDGKKSSRSSSSSSSRKRKGDGENTEFGRHSSSPNKRAKSSAGGVSYRGPTEEGFIEPLFPNSSSLYKGNNSETVGANQFKPAGEESGFEKAGNSLAQDDVTMEESMRNSEGADWSDVDSTKEHEMSASSSSEQSDWSDDDPGFNDTFASSAIFPSRASDISGFKIPKVRKPSAALGAPRRESTGNETGPREENTLENLIKEVTGEAPKEGKVGPKVSECIANMLKSFVKNPNAETILKLTEEYPRPANASWVKAPELGKEVAASIPRRNNNYDRKLKQSQECPGSAMTAVTSVLDKLLIRASKDEGLTSIGRQLIDALKLLGFVHSDFNTIREG